MKRLVLIFCVAFSTILFGQDFQKRGLVGCGGDFALGAYKYNGKETLTSMTLSPYGGIHFFDLLEFRMRLPFCVAKSEKGKGTAISSEVGIAPAIRFYTSKSKKSLFAEIGYTNRFVLQKIEYDQIDIGCVREYHFVSVTVGYQSIGEDNQGINPFIRWNYSNEKINSISFGLELRNLFFPKKKNPRSRIVPWKD